MTTITWASGSGPDAPATYGTAANWVGGVVPGANDVAKFANSHHPTINVSADATALGWSFSGTTDYTANITANLTLGNSGIGGKGLGFTNTGTLTLTGTANFGISTTIYSGTGTLVFYNQSSAGSASITAGANGSVTFDDVSTASQATITNNGFAHFHDQSTAAQVEGINNHWWFFDGNSTAAQANLTNEDLLEFSGHSTAGSAQITNGADLTFTQNATAGNAHVATKGDVTFSAASTAGTATITDINAGLNYITFTYDASADHATINGDFVIFDLRSTAANATLTRGALFKASSRAGSATIDGSTSFNDGSTADGATITGRASFFGTSTAGHATISGGPIEFHERATAGTARLISSAGQYISLYSTTGPNDDHRVSAGTLEGAGKLSTGANELTIGGNNLSALFAGTIVNNLSDPTDAVMGSLVKIGTGTQVLSGANTLRGGTTIQQGTLEIDGSLSGPVAVNGGTLSGRGAVSGTVAVGANGTLAPGAAIGAMTVDGLSMAAGAALSSDISGTSALASYDQLVVHGAIVLNGATLNASLVDGYDPGSVNRTSFTLIDNDGADAVSGTFAGLGEGGYFSIGARVFSITYRGGDGNDVVITSDGVVIAGTSKADTIDAKHAPSGQPKATALNDLIGGNKGDDKLGGAAGDDTISGGAGKDKIDGGKGGHDLADYSDKGSAVSVHLNGSHSITVKVGGKAEDSVKNVEDVRGGTAGDTLTGDDKANRLFGGGENDVLAGGKGKDVLTGDGGHDRFVFDTKLGAGNVDTVADFKHGDKLALDNAIFAAIGTKLDKAEFYAKDGATKAHDKNDHIIYDSLSGKLYYDADSKGGHDAVLFAIMNGHPGLGSGDFSIA